MEIPANQLTQKSQGSEEDSTLQTLLDKMEYMQIKANFFECQTKWLTEIIYNEEISAEESFKEEQEIYAELNKQNQLKLKLQNQLQVLKEACQPRAIEYFKTDGINNNCTECFYQSKYKDENFSHCPLWIIIN